MPQDQDDIKGGDAMKQAPTPGPLMSESGNLLVVGDWISHPEYGTAQYWPSAAGDRCLTGPWSFVGRPDADGWIDHKASDAPPPDYLMVEYITGSGLTSARMRVTELRWDRDFKWRPFRLTPTAPVEASEVGEMPWLEQALVEHLRSMGCKCPSPLIGYRPNAGPRCRLCNVEPERLRPQPSGGTREVAQDIASLKSQFERIAAKNPDDQPAYRDGCRPFGTGDLRHFIEVLGKAETLLSARPAPVASGGQHSSGEEIANRAEASNVLGWFSGLARKEGNHVQADWLDSYIASLSTTPARAEAQDEGAAGEREYADGEIIAFGLRMEGSSTLYPAIRNTKEGADKLVARLVDESPENPPYRSMPLYAHPSPTPAADADRVRIAVEASRDLLDACYRADENSDLSDFIDGMLLTRLDKALADLNPEAK